jgi:glycolate oxidase FAD binding subunit
LTDPVAVLASACGHVVPGGPADAVFGVVPAAVAAPGTIAEASDLLRTAAGHGLAVLPRGGGTKLGWGTPPDRCDVIIDTTRLDRVIEHAAGDLVVRVQAGIPMLRLAAHLAAADQQLALDTLRTDATAAAPSAAGSGGTNGSCAADAAAGQDGAHGRAGPDSASGTGGAIGGTSGTGGTVASAHRNVADAACGTVGGVVATGAAGPRRLRYGAPRDLLIGITVVLADGTVASSGGKVVKNVAGYDLGKLFAGSYGTLGLIVEATFRLHPLPQAAAYVTVTCATVADARDAVRAAIESQLAPSAAEIDRPGPGAPVSVCLLLEGAADAIPARAALMRDILGNGAQAGAAPPAWWGRRVAGAHATALRIIFPPDELPSVLDAVDEAAATANSEALSPAIRGSGGAGVLEAGLDAGISPEAAAAFVALLRRRLAAPPGWGDVPGASVIVVHAPPGVRGALDVWGPVTAAELMRAVKDRFDPGHVMSPGRFVGGI